TPDPELELVPRILAYVEHEPEFFLGIGLDLGVVQIIDDGFAAPKDLSLFVSCLQYVKWRACGNRGDQERTERADPKKSFQVCAQKTAATFFLPAEFRRRIRQDAWRVVHGR